jgi:hypothetical protein
VQIRICRAATNLARYMKNLATVKRVRFVIQSGGADEYDVTFKAPTLGMGKLVAWLIFQEWDLTIVGYQTHFFKQKITSHVFLQVQKTNLWSDYWTLYLL